MFLSILTTFIFSTSEPVLSLHIYEATEPVVNILKNVWNGKICEKSTGSVASYSGSDRTGTFFTYFSISDISEYIDKFYFFNIRTGSVASYIWSDRTGWQYTQKGLKRKNMWKNVPVLSLHIVEATEPVLSLPIYEATELVFF